MKQAIIKTGGKQYLVKEGDILYVERIKLEKGKRVELDTLAVYEQGGKADIGTPLLDRKVQAEVLEEVKGDKIRVARFKAKVRYRKVRGHRQILTKIKILKI